MPKLYSVELHQVVASMLTVDPSKRPTAQDVLKMKQLVKRDQFTNEFLRIP